MPTTKSPSELQVVDSVLTNVARRYEPDGFIYDQIAPTIKVDKNSGRYPTFDEAYWFAPLHDGAVADRAVTPEVDFTWSTDTFYCDNYRLKTSITDEERSQAHAGLRLETSKVQHLMTQMKLNRELRLANMLRKTSNGGDLTLGATTSNKWNTDAATIEDDIKVGALAVFDATGRAPNTIVIPYKVAYAAAVQQDIRELLKYTVNGQSIIQLGERVLPGELHGMKVVIPKAQYNTAKEGATTSINEIWSDSVRLVYVDPSAGWGIPNTVYRFENLSLTVDRWKENDPPADYIRAWERCDEKTCAAALGYEINDCL